MQQSNKVVAYVDGSYNAKTKEYAYGAVIFYNDEVLEFSEKANKPSFALMRNVAGEIGGAIFAMKFCIEHKVQELELYYDYEGIKKWCSGEWKTKKDGTKAYKRYYDSISTFLAVNFIKVKGHSGDQYNDRADRLAKDALGIK